MHHSARLLHVTINFRRLFFQFKGYEDTFAEIANVYNFCKNLDRRSVLYLTSSASNYLKL